MLRFCSPYNYYLEACLKEANGDAAFLAKAWDLRQAVAVMGSSQLGTELSKEEVDQITAFLNSLTGEQPKVVYPLLPPSTVNTPRPQP